MMNAVEVRDLSKRFGATKAVEGLDLEVRKGELFGLVGPDGAGKTTALRLLATIMVPSSGGGSVLGLDLTRDAEEIKRRVGYMPQRFSLYGELSVRENMEFFADIHRVFGPERAESFRRVLDFSRLEPFQDRLSRELSGGMKQKLALSCTLLHRPKILLLDEPTTGVDPISRRELWRLLLQLWRQGTTIIVTTPYMDEAERCERIGFMQHGRLLDAGSPAHFRESYPWQLVEIACGQRHRARALIAAQPGVAGVEVFGDRVHVRVDSAEIWVPRLRELLEQSGIRTEGAAPIQPSVEDVFLHLARGVHAP